MRREGSARHIRTSSFFLECTDLQVNELYPKGGFHSLRSSDLSFLDYLTSLIASSAVGDIERTKNYKWMRRGPLRGRKNDIQRLGVALIEGSF